MSQIFYVRINWYSWHSVSWNIPINKHGFNWKISGFVPPSHRPIRVRHFSVGVRLRARVPHSPDRQKVKLRWGPSVRHRRVHEEQDLHTNHESSQRLRCKFVKQNFAMFPIWLPLFPCQCNNYSTIQDMFMLVFKPTISTLTSRPGDPNQEDASPWGDSWGIKVLITCVHFYQWG